MRDSGTVWSASFSERFCDVLELEDSISEQVTGKIVPKLTGDERLGLAKRGTDIAEAHDAYLQGRFFWNQFTPDSFPKSIAAFQKAVELDPNYALAYVGIADYYTWAGIYGLYPPGEAYPRVYESATRALEIDPSLAEAHAALGLYYSNMQLFAESEQCYRKAIELNPNYPLSHEWLSAVLLGTGRVEEGSKEIIIAERLDPLSLRPKVLSAWHFYQVRDYSESLAKAEEILLLNPDFMQSHLQLANVLLEMGENERALTAARRAAELAPGSPLPIYVLAFALAANGLIEDARAIADALESQSENVHTVPYFIGMAKLAAGDRDAAFKYLFQAAEEKSAWSLWINTDPKLDQIREDPRFPLLLKASGHE
jgi:tetratricopeptide (TPR) repeat protein